MNLEWVIRSERRDNLILEICYFLCMLNIKNKKKGGKKRRKRKSLVWILPHKRLSPSYFLRREVHVEKKGGKEKRRRRRRKKTELHPPTRTFNLIKQPPWDCSTVAQAPRGEDSSSWGGGSWPGMRETLRLGVREWICPWGQRSPFQTAVWISDANSAFIMRARWFSF